ncbi:hypothetical protein RvY_00678 [Ramazzottius varieornatus]|uniref:Uncharacterized protein n=1 Tax=Ramazzottius varieornatus TaxID=947166 RepID=A0A1D1UH88_RAMVA|nr:hypothetical protein RvY_00678 [Ramazzottius varieornatus]
MTENSTALDILQAAIVGDRLITAASTKPNSDTSEEAITVPDGLHSAVIYETAPNGPLKPAVTKLASQRSTQIHPSRSVLPAALQRIGAPKGFPSKRTTSVTAKRTSLEPATKEAAKKPKNDAAETKANPEKPRYPCTYEGCERQKDPYKLKYAYDNHMKKHREQELGMAKVAAPRSQRSLSASRSRGSGRSKAR